MSQGVAKDMECFQRTHLGQMERGWQLHQLWVKTLEPQNPCRLALVLFVVDYSVRPESPAFDPQPTAQSLVVDTLSTLWFEKDLLDDDENAFCFKFRLV